MPETRLERTRRAYDRVIDLAPYGCKVRDMGSPDHKALNGIWDRQAPPHVHRMAPDPAARCFRCGCGFTVNESQMHTPVNQLPGWNVIEGEH